MPKAPKKTTATAALAAVAILSGYVVRHTRLEGVGPRGVVEEGDIITDADLKGIDIDRLKNIGAIEEANRFDIEEFEKKGGTINPGETDDEDEQGENTTGDQTLDTGAEKPEDSNELTPDAGNPAGAPAGNENS